MKALSPLAHLIYKPAMQKRRAQNLARRGEVAAPCPILSIGNLTTGGTGKTPAVQWAAKFLQEAGWKVGIASRGYGGALSEQGALVSDGIQVLLSAQEAGDEPILHAKKLPSAVIAIAKDRHQAVEMAVKQGAQVVILDDGFQFWSLPRAFELVLLDARQPFGNGYLLPAGRLREEPAALGRADAIILTRANRANAVELKNSYREIRRWSEKPIFEAIHAPLELRDEKTSQILALDELKGARVTTLSAIADNTGFKTQLEELGAIICGDIFRRDHYDWTKNPPPFVALTCVTTEKDSTKLNPKNFGGRLLSLRIGLSILKDEKILQTLIIQKLEAAQ